MIEERILNVVWARRKHRWVPRFALGLKGWAGISQVELQPDAHRLRCRHMGSPLGLGPSGVSRERHIHCFQAQPRLGRKPCGLKERVCSHGSLLAQAPNPPALARLSLLYNCCTSSSFHSALNWCFEFKNLGTRTPTGSGTCTENVCKPPSWQLVAERNIPFHLYNPWPSISWLSLWDRWGQGYRWSPRFPCSTFTWICTQTFLWSLPSPDAVFPSEGADKTSRGSAVLEF